MQWNNFTQIVFMAWIIITPIMVSKEIRLSEQSLNMLIYFDVIFMIDRFMDLFVGYFNPNGIMEHRLYAVIFANISPKLFLEFLIGFGPIMVTDMTVTKSMWYALFKIPRYSRLFEIDGQIADILDFYG
jgi:hypothetical protein